MSPSSRRAWIEIQSVRDLIIRQMVALLAEGVDRNRGLADPDAGLQQSPSSRRAWIEITMDDNLSLAEDVALLAEGVDRNFLLRFPYASIMSRPPRGGRG